MIYHISLNTVKYYLFKMNKIDHISDRNSNDLKLVTLFDILSESESELAIDLNKLSDLDCNSIFEIEGLLTSNLDDDTLKILEKYFIENSVKGWVNHKFFFRCYKINVLNFIKNMIDYDLIELDIPTDITAVFRNYATYNIKLAGGFSITKDNICDIFKWYHSSEWKFTYEVYIVFREYISNSKMEDIIWWYENDLPRDYSLIKPLHFLFYESNTLKYFLNMMLLDNAVQSINYFDCVDYVDYTNRITYNKSETDRLSFKPDISNIRIFTNFCLENGAKFVIDDIVYNCLFPMIQLYTLDREVYNLFYDNFIWVIENRPLTRKEISRLYYGYLLLDCFDKLQKNVLEYIERILEFPIDINCLDKNCDPNDYVYIIEALTKMINLRRDKLISEGKLIFDVNE